MISVALKMLIGNRASFIGVLFGIFLATLLISQQSAIFLGLLSRSYRIVTDISVPNLWVMDPATESDDKLRVMPAGYLDVVRSIPGIEWAVPINVITVPLVTGAGKFEIGQLYAIDDATLTGAPQNMIAGDIKDLRREGAVIVDIFSARDLLATKGPDGKKVPLKIGDSFEINGKRAVVVGIARVSQGFYPQPILYTTNSQMRYFNSWKNDSIGLIAAKTLPDANVKDIQKKINAYKVMNALTRDEFRWKITEFFLKTGILINFGLSVLLGLIIGFSIAGQIFYIMTLQNLSYYALIKSTGGTHKTILKMIVVQALLVGVIGFLLGTGATLLWGYAIKETSLAFWFPWQLLIFTGSIVLLICIFTAGLSIRKVFRVDPKSLMGN